MRLREALFGVAALAVGLMLCAIVSLGMIAVFIRYDAQIRTFFRWFEGIVR